MNLIVTDVTMTGETMKTSIGSYSFHGMLSEGKMDIFGYLETVKYRYNLGTADIWNMMLASTEEDYLRKVREALDEKELSVANLCVDGASLWDDDSEVRDRQYRNASANLRAAEILGAKTVRIDMGGRGHVMTEEQIEYVVTRYKEYANRALNNGFMIGPENHFGPALVPDNMLKVAEAVSHKAYGILLHLGHWDVDLENGDRLLAKWAVHTHVDADTCANGLDQKLQTLMNAGYNGYWGIEHHSGVNEYVEVEWQLASVRRALVKLHGDRQQDGMR